MLLTIYCEQLYRLGTPVTHQDIVFRVTGVQKHSKSGANVKDTIDDITLYNMKSFRSVVLYVGGNDSSSGIDIKLFEEKYDELVS